MTNDKDHGEEFNRLQNEITTARGLRHQIPGAPDVQAALKALTDELTEQQASLLIKASSPPPTRVIYNRIVINNLPFGTVGYFEDTKGRCSVKLHDGWTDGSKGPLTLWSLGEFA